jgi:hypothetical protein
MRPTLKKSRASRPCSTLFCLFLLTTLSALAQTGLVISQVYGGGGNSGSTYKNDFIELFNPTSTTLTLTGYSVQYAGPTTTSVYSVGALPTTITLAPGAVLPDPGGCGGWGDDEPAGSGCDGVARGHRQCRLNHPHGNGNPHRPITAAKTR